MTFGGDFQQVAAEKDCAWRPGACGSENHGWFLRAYSKGKSPLMAPLGDCIKGGLQVGFGICKEHEVIGVKLTRETEIWVWNESDTRWSTSDGGCKAVDQKVEKKWWEHTSLSNTRVDPRRRYVPANSDLREGATKEIGHCTPHASSDPNLVQPDKRRLNPRGVKSFTDVDEGAEGVHVLTQPQCVQEPVHASICSPTKAALALIEAIRDVRCDPAMHQPLEDLECAGRQWNRSVMVWLGWVPVLEDGDNVAELPGRRDHVPSEDQVEKLEKHVVPPRQARLECTVRKAVLPWSRVVTQAQSIGELWRWKRGIEGAWRNVSSEVKEPSCDWSREVREKSSYPPDAVTDEKCVLQWSHARAERQTMNATALRHGVRGDSLAVGSIGGYDSRKP